MKSNNILHTQPYGGFKPAQGQINFIDAHCHLTEERIFSNLETEITEAIKAGITNFISSALCQKEFAMITLPKFQKLRKIVKWTAGIHPYYDESVEADFSTLVKLCDERQIIAIGEIGLDKRNDNFEWQKNMLLRQLDLAKNYDLPVVFHNVRQYYEMHKILKNNFPKVRGVQHSFKGSQQVFEVYKNYDIAFSMCGKLPKDEVIMSILKHGLYLFETDAPYQKPKDLSEDFTHLKSLIWTVDRINKIFEVNKQELVEVQLKSFEQIFGKIL